MPNLKIVAYARFSSDNQRTESIDAQLRAIREYCKKENYQIINIYTDEIRSGLSDERPGFLEMIDDAEMNQFDAIVVHKLDRFSRDRYDSALYKRRLKKAGVKLFSVLERLDDSPESIILESVLEGMAEYYSKNLARETFKGLKENALKCQHNGGIPPLGYDVDPQTKKYIINDYEADTVRMIFDLYLRNSGYSEISEKLNTAGRLTKRNKPFGKNSLYEVLNNDKYIGFYTYNKVANRRLYGANRRSVKDESEIIRIKGGIPAIIEDSQWQEVRERMSSNKRKTASYKAKYVYPLSGLITCGKCGSAYCGHHRSSRSYHNFYYVCSNKHNKGECDAKSVSKELLETAVVNELEKRLFSENGLEATAKYIQNYAITQNDHQLKRLSGLKSELEKTNIQIGRIVDAVVDGMYHETMKERLTQFEAKRNNLEREIRNYEENMENMIPSLEDIKMIIGMDNIRTMDENKLKECFQKYVKKITILEDGEIEIDLVVHINGVP